MADSGSEIANLISKYKASPLLPLELTLIIQILKIDGVSVDYFKNHYFRDPLLCAYIIDLAWQKTKNKDNHPFAADHAMSTVGIEGAKTFLSGIPDAQQPELSEEVKFVMSSSLLAAELAKNLCHNKQKSKPLYWASMAHQLPELLLWYLKPKPMWRIQYRQIKLAKKLAVFEQAKLGFELSEWRQAVCKEWHMSELNQITYNKTVPDSRKQLIEYMGNNYSRKTPCLKEWQHTDSWQILTANWLARAILSPWLTNSYQHYYNIAKQAFSINDKKLSHTIMDSVRTTSEHLKGSLLFVPAASLINLPSKSQFPNWLNAAPKIPTKRNPKFVQQSQQAQQAQQLKPSSNQLAIQKLMKELKETPEKFTKTNELFLQVLQLCIKHLGFSRACLMIVNRKNKKVTTGIALKQDDREKIRPDFGFEENTPLNKFLVDRGFLLFELNKHSKIWHKLPPEIIKQQVKSFILYSLKPRSQVKALIYLDMQGQNPPSQQQIKIVKALLHATNGVLAGQIK